MKQHKLDTNGKALAIGQKAEDDFIITMEERGWEVLPASPTQNMKEHWDYLIKKGTSSLRVEVKAEKRINRRDEETQDEWVWIEFQAVNGSIGWLYGKADYIAFQRSSGYAFINREILAEVAERLTKPEYVSSAGQAKYRYYRRFRRNDLLTLLNFNDIKDYCIKL